MRTYGEVIAVRPCSGPGSDSGSGTGAGTRSPTAIAVGCQFLWRSRVYVIGSVLAHWIESGTWWTSLHQPIRSNLGLEQTADDCDLPRSITRDVGAMERWVWRVEASASSSALIGVYDLACEVNVSATAAQAGSGPTRWRLARALD
jgi:hypothetical protein